MKFSGEWVSTEGSFRVSLNQNLIPIQYGSCSKRKKKYTQSFSLWFATLSPSQSLFCIQLHIAHSSMDCMFYSLKHWNFVNYVHWNIKVSDILNWLLVSFTIHAYGYFNIKLLAFQHRTKRETKKKRKLNMSACVHFIDWGKGNKHDFQT